MKLPALPQHDLINLIYTHSKGTYENTHKHIGIPVWILTSWIHVKIMDTWENVYS
jgi:hypothetical protein